MEIELFETNPIIKFKKDGTVDSFAWGPEKRIVTKPKERVKTDGNKKPIIKTKSFLKGVTIEGDEIKLTDNCTLRRLKRDDFIETYSADFPHVSIKNLIQLGHQPTLILQMNSEVTSENDFGEAQLQAELIVTALRLFKTAPIENSRLKFDVGGTLFTTRHSLNENCVITTKETKYFVQFCNILTQKLDRDFIYGTSDYLSYAFRRYSEELLYGGREEDRVSSAIMVLETLYSSHQKVVISQRAAKILTFLGDDPLKVRDIIKEAYYVRHKFVHGALINNESSEKARRVRPMIFDIARKSIVSQLYLL